MQPDEGLFTRQLPGDRFREQTDPVLQLENINVSFDGFRALTDLSLAIGVGELRCVIGPNGAGKTTLMDVITGKTRPQSGKALYDQSVDLTTLDPVAIARQGLRARGLGEERYLAPLEAVIESGETQADRWLRLCATEWNGAVSRVLDAAAI